jgi:hypothetical protein
VVVDEIKARFLGVSFVCECECECECMYIICCFLKEKQKEEVLYLLVY